MCPLCAPFFILIPLAIVIGVFHKPTGLWLRRMGKEGHLRLLAWFESQEKKNDRN